MRHLPYKWEDILEEDVPKTMISIKYLKKEKELEQKIYEEKARKAKRKMR